MSKQTIMSLTLLRPLAEHFDRVDLASGA